MDQPIVSVIIPAYNCAGTIGDTLESVLRQRVPMEVIVVNDCSPDRLDDAMARYRGNPCIAYLKNEKNLGASGSRNKAVALAKGKYVAFVDSDDQWADNRCGAVLHSKGTVDSGRKPHRTGDSCKACDQL